MATMGTKHDAAQLEAFYAAHVAHLNERYGRALEAAGYDTLVIHSGTAREQCPFDDQYWPLRPTPAFSHWLPLIEPRCALVIEPGKKPVLHRPLVQDFWEGPLAPESEHFWSELEVCECDSVATLMQRLPRGERVAYIGSDPGALEALAAPADAINPPALITAVDEIRSRKTDYERLCIAEANRRACLGHAAVMDAFVAAPVSELELHLMYLQVTQQDATDTPYSNIVAIDEHAATLHHIHYGRSQPGDSAHSLLVDAGATYLGYASDVTRTTVFGEGADADAFRQLVRHIEALQAAVIDEIRVGKNYEELHDHAHELLADVLRELGVGKASRDELVQSGATRTFLPHGLGHSLGIQVHDVGTRGREPKPENPFLRNTSDIAEGQVFTIEPGCYFIGPLLEKLREQPVAASLDWGLIDRLARFGGVRIEDNIAVLADGTVNLTRDNWPDTP